MPQQGSLFDEIIPQGCKERFSGESLRDKGMKRAIDHANEVHDKWSERAYEFTKTFIVKNKRFLTEDIRIASAGILPEPPSNRSWGSVIVRAAKAGLIKQIGYRKVTNPLAHKANAAWWETV